MKGTIFGLQRSGTNFTETLLKENFNINICNSDKNYIWKHSYNFDLTKIKEENFHVYIIKYPYSWLESIRRKQVDIIKRNPGLKNDKDTKFEFKGLDVFRLAKLYNDHVLWWYNNETVKEKCKPIFINYEDLIIDNESITGFLKNFAIKYNLTPKRDLSQTINPPQKVSQSDKWSDETKKMYLNKILPTLEWEHIKEINRGLSEELFETIGYKRINSKEDLIENHK